MGKVADAPNVGFVPYTAAVTGGMSWQSLGLLAKTNAANAFTVGGHTITAESATVKPLILKGAASQTANVFEVQNSSGTANFYVDQYGQTQSFGSIVVRPTSAGSQVIIAKGAASQSANLQEWQNSAGTVVANMQAGGNLKASNVATLNSLAQLAQANSGGVFIMARQTAAYSNPGANSAALYFRDGTNAGTLKLVVRAGAAGAETTILDNIPQ